VISRRVRGGWSAPAFFNLTGGSFGAQIGAQKTDYVLLIMNEEGTKSVCSKTNSNLVAKSAWRLVSRSRSSGFH